MKAFWCAISQDLTLIHSTNTSNWSLRHTPASIVLWASEKFHLEGCFLELTKIGPKTGPSRGCRWRTALQSSTSLLPIYPYSPPCLRGAQRKALLSDLGSWAGLFRAVGLVFPSVWKEPQTGINTTPKRSHRVFAKCAKPLIFNKFECISSWATNRLL